MNDMQNRVEKAIALFNSGYNCAQAVLQLMRIYMVSILKQL